MIIFAIDRCAGRERRRVHAEHLGRGRAVDVLAARERLAQLRLARDVREDPQLDLRVVGREQPVALLGDERRADLAAELGADRDRLQVRVGGREPAGRGDRLVERRVQPPVVLVEISDGSGPRYVFSSFESSRHSSITGTIACSCRIERSTFASVE